MYPLIIYVRTDTVRSDFLSCTRPLYVTYCNGRFGRFGGRLSQGVLDAYKDSEIDVVPVPCGRCPGCRLDRAKAWSDRMLVEYNANCYDYPPRTALFVTLTYDELHKPCVECTDGVSRGNLDVRDIQLFIKRLRKYLSHRVRYFCAGEYGDTTFRPHYHLILFGCCLDDFSDVQVYCEDVKLKQILYVSAKLDSLWSNGSVKFCPATYGTMAYVAQYVLKKQYTSDNPDDFYRGRKPPFITMSRRPGIGGSAFELESIDDDLLLPSVAVNDGNYVHVVKIPRAFLQKLRLTDSDLFDKIMLSKREIASAIDVEQKSRIDDDYFAYLRNTELALLRRRVSKSQRNKI